MKTLGKKLAPLGALLAMGLVASACGDNGNNNNEDKPACSDGIDNDGDVFPDFPGDPGCDSADDNDEVDNQCNNGIDDDFDGQVDTADPECLDATGTAEANAALIPDLRMTPLVADINANVIEVEGVQANDRERRAGCFTGEGTRRILRWDSIIENVGNTDLLVGNTDNHAFVELGATRAPVYTIARGLDQLEFFGWTRSFLINDAGTVIAEGHKGSFCMLNLSEVDGFDLGPAPASNCFDNQRISDGFGDVYNQGLECQFIDITDIDESGALTLRVETNFTKQLPESDYTNNAQEYIVNIPAQ
jgi:hypothetical protein